MNIDHPALLAVAETCKGSAYQDKLWLVGGAVRDFLLGKELPNDFDIVIENDAVALASYLYQKGVSKIAPVLYPRFGTALIRIQNTNVELVTARKETYTSSSRKPEIRPATLYEDALRRDFTINTLMINLHTHQVLDPLGVGLQDLQSRTLRTPLDPEKTFHEDPLRMLRAIRFSWQLGCKPVAGLYEAVKVSSERLKIISMERIRDELNKMLLLKDADCCFQDLLEVHLLERFTPELVQMVGVNQGSHHHLDVWSHSLLTLKSVGAGDLVLSWAALLHDVAKPSTKFIDDKGNPRFFGHETVGAELTRQILKRLKYPESFIQDVALLVKNHMRLGAQDPLSDTAIRRILRDLLGHVDQLFKLTEADAMAHRPGFPAPSLAELKKRFTFINQATPHDKLKSPLSGTQIMSLTKMSSGPIIGQIKEFLNEQVLEGKLLPDDTETAKHLVKEWITKYKD